MVSLSSKLGFYKGDMARGVSIISHENPIDSLIQLAGEFVITNIQLQQALNINYRTAAKLIDQYRVNGTFAKPAELRRTTWDPSKDQLHYLTSPESLRF